MRETERCLGSSLNREDDRGLDREQHRDQAQNPSLQSEVRERYRAQLRQLMREQLAMESVPQLTDELRLGDDLLIDSVMLLQLLVAIELHWQLAVPEDGLFAIHLNTVAN